MSKVTNKQKTIVYFCDESHIRGHNWFGVGGLAVNTGRIAEIEDEILELRASHGYGGRSSEIQWKNVSARRDDIHKAFVDLLADRVTKGHIHVHFRFTPVFERSAKPDEISRAFYQLLLHRVGRFYCEDSSIVVRPDNGCCTEYLPKMLVGLNNDICRKFNVVSSKIRDISPLNSRSSHLLQLLDVALGGLTSRRNEQYRPSPLGTPKEQLSLYIQQKLNIDDISRNSSMRSRKVNVWNVDPH